jgi:hypothetical protein
MKIGSTIYLNILIMYNKILIFCYINLSKLKSFDFLKSKNDMGQRE